MTRTGLRLDVRCKQFIRRTNDLDIVHYSYIHSPQANRYCYTYQLSLQETEAQAQENDIATAHARAHPHSQPSRSKS